MSGRRLTLVVLVLAAAVGTIAVLAKGRTDPLALTCAGPGFTSSQDPSGPIARTLLLVDLSDNRRAAVDRIAGGVQPYVDRALQHGGLVKLIVSGGDGRPLVKSSCLDGRTTLFVARENATREAKDRATASASIGDHLRALLGSTRVSARGTATKLLADAPGELADMVPSHGRGGAGTVVLWSDLLGSTRDRGDCLRLDGEQGTPQTADSLVQRCLQVGQLTPLPAGVALRVVRGGGSDEHTGDAVVGEALAASLCTRLATRCDGS